MKDLANPWSRLLTWRWILTSLFVIAGVALCIRLGIWQLDRLAARRDFNARVESQINAPALDLNHDHSISGLSDMEYRSVTVRGKYDFSQEILLRNQSHDGQLGYHVFTPLLIDGSSQAVLVERGWIPFDQAAIPARETYYERGEIVVQGRLRKGISQPDFGGVPNPTLLPGQSRLESWNFINIEEIQRQTRLKLLPLYIQQAPGPGWVGPPYRVVILPEITEGPHLGYALQWFAFATILGLGYPFFVRKQLRTQRITNQGAAAASASNGNPQV